MEEEEEADDDDGDDEEEEEVVEVEERSATDLVSSRSQVDFSLDRAEELRQTGLGICIHGKEEEERMTKQRKEKEKEKEELWRTWL